jgi:hypothetical protein
MLAFMAKKTDAAPVVPLTEQEIRLVAAYAGADVRTVRRWLDSGEVRGAILTERLMSARKRVEAERDGAAPLPGDAS